jgi:hypothetical protein
LIDPRKVKHPHEGVKKGMIVRAAIDIEAPAAVVWQVFSRIEEWGRWNTACDRCRLTVGDRLEPGACLTFVVKPFVFPVRVAPRVVHCDPGREVVWEGGRWGVHAVHRWRFCERSGGVRLESTENFDGPLMPIARICGLQRRLHRLTERMLAQIRSHAETCAA